MWVHSGWQGVRVCVCVYTTCVVLTVYTLEGGGVWGVQIMCTEDPCILKYWSFQPVGFVSSNIPRDPTWRSGTKKKRASQVFLSVALNHVVLFQLNTLVAYSFVFQLPLVRTKACVPPTRAYKLILLEALYSPQWFIDSTILSFSVHLTRFNIHI